MGGLKGRPAELSAAGLGGLAAALSVALKLTQPWTAVVVAAVGLVPGVVSYLVERQGLVGAVKSLFKGRPAA